MTERYLILVGKTRRDENATPRDLTYLTGVIKSAGGEVHSSELTRSTDVWRIDHGKVDNCYMEIDYDADRQAMEQLRSSISHLGLSLLSHLDGRRAVADLPEGVFA